MLFTFTGKRGFHGFCLEASNVHKLILLHISRTSDILNIFCIYVHSQLSNKNGFSFVSMQDAVGGAQCCYDCRNISHDAKLSNIEAQPDSRFDDSLEGFDGTSTGTSNEYSGLPNQIDPSWKDSKISADLDGDVLYKPIKARIARKLGIRRKKVLDEVGQGNSAQTLHCDLDTATFAHNQQGTAAAPLSKGLLDEEHSIATCDPPYMGRLNNIDDMSPSGVEKQENNRVKLAEANLQTDQVGQAIQIKGMENSMGECKTVDKIMYDEKSNVVSVISPHSTNITYSVMDNVCEAQSDGVEQGVAIEDLNVLNQNDCQIHGLAQTGNKRTDKDNLLIKSLKEDNGAEQSIRTLSPEDVIQNATNMGLQETMDKTDDLPIAHRTSIIDGTATNKSLPSGVPKQVEDSTLQPSGEKHTEASEELLDGSGASKSIDRKEVTLKESPLPLGSSSSKALTEDDVSSNVFE